MDQNGPTGAMETGESRRAWARRESGERLASDYLTCEVIEKVGA